MTIDLEAIKARAAAATEAAEGDRRGGREAAGRSAHREGIVLRAREALPRRSS
jgi:hypothetical protein